MTPTLQGVFDRIKTRSGAERRTSGVVSTPESSWFTRSCGRGPGIAAFLATARMAAQPLKNVNLVFVAATGHEAGHGGMEYFIKDKAPKPKDVAL